MREFYPSILILFGSSVFLVGSLFIFVSDIDVSGTSYAGWVPKGMDVGPETPTPLACFPLDRPWF